MRNIKTAVFTDPKNTPSKIAKTLIKRGAKGYKVMVFEALGTKDERITRGSLASIAKLKFNPLNLMVLFNTGAHGEQRLAPLFGLDASKYNHTDGLITKAEVRAITLAKLDLLSDQGLIIWDIGSGSGSVSIEAAGLAASGVVYAIECKAERIKNIEANRARFKRSNVEIVKASAPAGLLKLPDPDRVFVGGGGKGLTDILKVVSKRLRPDALVVVNAVTLETLCAASKFFKENGWSFEVVSVNISRSREIAGVKIMDAENPVSIISAKRA